MKRDRSIQKKKTGSRRGRTTLFSFGLALALFLSPLALEVAAAEEPDALVSPALCVLAEQNAMAMAGLRGNPLKMDGEDFARAMNLSKVSSLTITQTPPVTDGELRVGSTVVNNGQTIRDGNLSLLTYVAGSSDIRTSSFRFQVNGSPVEMTCKLYLLDQVNQSPTLDLVPETFLSVSTHRNVTLYGTLPCHDPEGDETIVEIVSYPETGILTLTDRKTGAYTFTPDENTSGKDSFIYVARDIYGNYSAAATVSLKITKPSTSVVYADMANSPAYNAALTMTEEGIMGGTQVGAATYFYPDQTVSRGEFLVMAMNAVGMTEMKPVSRTVFADDGEIHGEMKNYVAAAYELGYVKGEVDANGRLCFAPNRAITRAEAAVILGNLLDPATPTVKPVFSDSSQIPAWAEASVNALTFMGIMNTTDGNISPLASLTRADAAQILTNVLVTAEK